MKIHMDQELRLTEFDAQILSKPGKIVIKYLFH